MFEHEEDLTVEVIHARIMRRAEELANERYAGVFGAVEEAVYNPGERFKAPPGKRRPMRGVPSGKIFRYDEVMTQRGGLTLSIEPGIDWGLTPEEREALWEIGAQAIEDALFENEEMFVAGILRDALQGTNYFDRFARRGEQGTLF